MSYTCGHINHIKKRCSKFATILKDLLKFIITAYVFFRNRFRKLLYKTFGT